jgi:hypothetical protein
MKRDELDAKIREAKIDIELLVAIKNRERRIERRRCVGLVLKAYGVMKMNGFMDTADALDQLATEMEHPAAVSLPDVDPLPDDEEA